MSKIFAVISKTFEWVGGPVYPYMAKCTHS